MMRFILYPLFFLCISYASHAQSDLGVPAGSGKGGTATTILKNWEAIGINPANLGWSENKTFSLGVFNSIGFNIQSQALDLKTIYNGYFHKKDSISSTDKISFTDLFTTEGGVNMQTHVNWLAASTQLPKIGGIAVNVRDRLYTHLHFSSNLVDVLFNGINAASYIDTVTPNLLVSNFADGTEINFLHYRECNISYGRKIISLAGIDLYAGVGYKKLWGLGYMNIDINEDVFEAQSALSSRYNISNVDSGFNIQDADNLFNNVGNGNAFDLGASAIFKSMFKFGISFTDMGSIKWKNNVMSAIDTLVPALDSTMSGMESFEVSNATDVLFGETGFLQFKPSESFTTAMPARMRIGAGIKFLKILELAADMVVPLNNATGNLKNPYFALGGELNIIGTLKINTGISTCKDFGYAVPLGLGFGIAGIVEFSVSTGDVLTWVGASTNPNASLIIGVFRFNLL